MCTGKKNDDFDFESLDDNWFAALCRSQGLDAADIIPQYDGGGAERIIDLQVRTGPWGDRYGEVPDGLTLEQIKAQPHGIDMGPMVSRVDEMVCTPDGLIDLAPAYIVGDLPRLSARIAETDDGRFRLVSRRHLRSKNSWLHNVKVLVKGKDRCTLLVHPEDAAGVGLVDGGRARVTSEAGSVEVPVEVSDEMMPGVVSLPHGWGHDRPGTRMAVAREHAGVNNNLLAPTHFYDTLSNNHAVNGIPVEVVPA
jgi:anaerobic selenocysteine-containing dehydrogenase